ncbi:MAG: hypothetical protein ACI8VC_000680 [Candidatus Endobugula sp.]|jgi:hypothetical protein
MEVVYASFASLHGCNLEGQAGAVAKEQKLIKPSITTLR